MNDLINRLHPQKNEEIKNKETFEIKLSKKTFFNVLVLLIIVFMIFQLVELVLIAQALKTGALCK